ncbi:MAG: aminotransferase class III-fold pyridoxal phosphate-dependent enzyme [Phycisphaerae bacterium]|nr:aminotransferase class III-fold pyridoxal phosphate-dependent enzyme [Phycisphaerae bacterium]
MGLSNISEEVYNKFKNSQAKTIERLNRECVNNYVLNEQYGLNDKKIYIKKAYGPYLEDFDDNRYIDTAMGGGTFLLGHAPAFILDQVRKKIDDGTLYTMPTFIPHEFAKLVSKCISHFSSFVFCNSGSEATMRVMRIARAFTKKKKIGIFSGGWHGSHDGSLVGDNYETDKDNPGSYLLSGGIPEEFLNLVVLLPYNNDRAFEIILKHKNDLALVFIEPSQGSNPRDDVKDFLLKLRDITAENDILLGFDEIITGFRLALGGGQEYYNIKADIATYGKAVGGGFPVGIIGGREEVMNVIKKDHIFMGGTFSANPITTFSGMMVLKHLMQNSDTIYPSMFELGNLLKTRMNDLCVRKSIPIRMQGIGSMLRLIFTDYPIKSRRDRDEYECDRGIQDLFYTEMLNRGVHVGSNRIVFLSTAHTISVVKELIDIYTNTFEYFSKKGLWEIALSCPVNNLNHLSRKGLGGIEKYRYP